jgi:Low-density lipoprotein receptor repeat class B
MKTLTINSYLSLLLVLAVFSSACRKKAPEGFSADFEINYNNGGMAPDLITLRAQFADADTYDWSVEGVPLYGQQTTFNAQSAGSFYVTLEVESGQHKKTKSANVAVENYPTNGEAMTVVQSDGVIGTFGVDGAQPFFVPIDTIAPDGLNGMDYDNETRELYYTSSIIRAFPNGAEKKLILSDDQLSGGDKIVDLVVDSEEHRVYFAINGSSGLNAIASIDQDGNDLRYETQFEFPNAIFDITLDEFENTVYFTGSESTAIFKIIEGELIWLYADNFLKHALIFDNSTGFLYFAEQVFNTPAGQINIMRFNPKNYNPDLSETWPQVVVENASTQAIHGMDISESKQQLYWSDTGQHVIYRIDLNNAQATREIIFTNITNPRAIAISDFN